MRIFARSGGVGCDGVAYTNIVDELEQDRLYEEHVAACPSCGKRIPENLTPELGRGLRSAAFGMFTPLAVAEASATCALGLALVDVGTGRAVWFLIGTLGMVALFVALQLHVADRLLARFALPALAPRFFRSPVSEPRSFERLDECKAFIKSYLIFARRAPFATLLVYALGAVAVLAFFGRVGAGLAIAAAGVVWAVSFRVRLSSLDPRTILDVDHDELDDLAAFQAKSSRLERIFARRASRIRIMHVAGIACVAATALVLDADRHVAVCVAICVAGLAWFWRWSARQLAGGGDCFLLRR